MELAPEPEGPTALERIFPEAGLPVAEVDAGPVEDCPVCRAGMLGAA